MFSIIIRLIYGAKFARLTAYLVLVDLFLEIGNERLSAKSYLLEQILEEYIDFYWV